MALKDVVKHGIRHSGQQAAHLAEQVVRGEINAADVRKIVGVDSDGRPVYEATDALVALFNSLTFSRRGHRPNTKFGSRHH